jgi:hypothetical protein
MMLDHLTRKRKEDLSEAERNVLAWAALLDFGFEFCLQTIPQLRPGTDPMEEIRVMYRRMSEEHLRGNENMVRRLSRPHG